MMKKRHDKRDDKGETIVDRFGIRWGIMTEQTER